MNAETPIKSPCISVCTLNEEDLCIGCFRTVSEITQWTRLNNQQRLAVLDKCRERAKIDNPFAQ